MQAISNEVAREALAALLACKENDRDALGAGPLYAACHAGEIDAARLLIQAGASINIQAIGGSTPLLTAVSAQNYPLVDELLVSGACPYYPSSEGFRAPVAACALNAVKIMERFLAEGVDANVANDDGVTGLHLAVQRNHAAVARLLVLHGADPTLCDNHGDSALTTFRLGNAAYEIARNAVRIRSQYWLSRLRTAVRAWCITNYWWRIAGEGQHGPGPDAPGHARAIAEFEAMALHAT